MSKGLFDIEALIEGLQQQRDELKLQIGLAKAEARDEWEQVEKKLQQLRAKTGRIGQETGAASKDVFAAAQLMADEIRRGYERIRKHL